MPSTCSTFTLYTHDFPGGNTANIFKFDARQAGAFEQIPMVVCQRRAMVAGKFCSELLSENSGAKSGQSSKSTGSQLWVLYKPLRSCGIYPPYPGDD